MGYNRKVIDRQNALKWFLEIVEKDQWVTLDTETTGMNDPQIVEWGICMPDLTVISGRVCPKKSIEPGAFNVHGISNDDVMAADPFPAAWQFISKIIGNKDIIIYNEPYDRSALINSAAAYHMETGCIFRENATFCAMRKYGAFEGTLNNYGDSYKWWKLEKACEQLGLEIEGKAHSAGTDALSTARIVLKLADIARKELSNECFQTSEL